MNGILGYDTFLGRLINKTIDYIFLFFLWILCSLPIITIGASTCAFYYTFNKALINERGYIARSFFKSFKENFKQATGMFIIQAIIAVLLALNISYLYLLRETFNTLISWIILVLVSLAFLWTTYWFPYVAFFTDKTKTVLNNCRIIMVRHMPWTLAILALFIIMIVIAYKFSIALILMLAVDMALNGLIFSFVYKKYMPEEPGDKDIVESTEEEAIETEE